MISKRQVKLIKQLEQKKYRRQEGLFVAEGPKIVGDLIDEGFQPFAVYATSQWERFSDDCQEVTEDELRAVSFLQHPQQVLALFRMPLPQPIRMESVNTRLSIALDGVQDPGNLGTIIRLADWFGISTIYCSPDTVDAWNPKVVQATMGSIARVHVVYTDLKALISEAQVPVYGTLLDGHNLYEEQLTPHGIIVMGNEGNGISSEIRQMVSRKLLIPKFHEGPESLNVAIATAITCAEFRRQFPES